MSDLESLPVVVIGTGPVGLAAARLIERGLRPLVLERGASAGAAVASWGHVRVFSPWSFNIDAAARALLAATGWRAPDPAALPTGRELVRDYLAPLAAHPALAPAPRRSVRPNVWKRHRAVELGLALTAAIGGTAGVLAHPRRRPFAAHSCRCGPPIAKHSLCRGPLQGRPLQQII